MNRNTQTFNTKLTGEEKAYLKKLKHLRNLDLVTSRDGRVTVAIQRRGNTSQMAVSIASPQEKKLRRKVGEYFALIRLVDGVSVPVGNNTIASVMANEIADNL